MRGPAVWGRAHRAVGLGESRQALACNGGVDVTLAQSPALFRMPFLNLIAGEPGEAMVARWMNGQEDPSAGSARREGTAARIYGSAPGASAWTAGLIDTPMGSSAPDPGEPTWKRSGRRYGKAGRRKLEGCAHRSGLSNASPGGRCVAQPATSRKHDLLGFRRLLPVPGRLS